LTWCAPCKEEMPSLNNIKNISELKKINIIPINIGEEEYEKSKIFFDELGIDNLEIFSGPSGDLAKKFKLRGVPTTIILDKEGHEISRILGSIDFLDKQFLEWLKSIVNS
jgi:thioredoxin-related protein